MADKDITWRQKNSAGTYDKLYMKTTATQAILSDETSALFNNATNADGALKEIAAIVNEVGIVLVRVKDPSGNPIQGVEIQGLRGNPITDASGNARGILSSNPITAVSPYADLSDKEFDVSTYVGTFNVAEIILPVAGENAVVRYSTSRNIKFSKNVKSVDVCCVGAGGGGSGGYGHSDSSSSGGSFIGEAWVGKGGGGGNIVSAYDIAVEADTDYPIVIGAGGAGSLKKTYNTTEFGDQRANRAGDGGTTTFLNVSATGGTGGYLDVGTSENGGNGTADATGTEFDDGSTYYSGGGANGADAELSAGATGPKGGSPYGGYGGYTYRTSTDNIIAVVGKVGTGAGGGGGGGAGRRYQLSSGGYTLYCSDGGNGANGLVAIRFHY